ncbi:hypothetical protein BDN71DRAFT_1047168 [Pleurotus eryngii]|uniref:Uncharacterized protein n=1 Tax=Pleurotus eryngii TaxID=5323 RepID=A0A9P6DBS0_PLEER|nr:hypothetical protein BDN71DRAFT_1047168 [Pleurotus eryngii]
MLPSVGTLMLTYTLYMRTHGHSDTRMCIYADHPTTFHINPTNPDSSTRHLSILHYSILINPSVLLACQRVRPLAPFVLLEAPRQLEGESRRISRPLVPLVPSSPRLPDFSGFRIFASATVSATHAIRTRSHLHSTNPTRPSPSTHQVIMHRATRIVSWYFRGSRDASFAFYAWWFCVLCYDNLLPSFCRVPSFCWFHTFIFVHVLRVSTFYAIPPAGFPIRIRIPPIPYHPISEKLHFLPPWTPFLALYVLSDSRCRSRLRALGVRFGDSASRFQAGWFRVCFLSSRPCPRTPARFVFGFRPQSHTHRELWRPRNYTIVRERREREAAKDPRNPIALLFRYSILVGFYACYGCDLGNGRWAIILRHSVSVLLVAVSRVMPYCTIVYGILPPLMRRVDARTPSLRLPVYQHFSVPTINHSVLGCLVPEFFFILPLPSTFVIRNSRFAA